MRAAAELPLKRPFTDSNGTVEIDCRLKIVVSDEEIVMHLQDVRLVVDVEAVICLRANLKEALLLLGGSEGRRERSGERDIVDVIEVYLLIIADNGECAAVVGKRKVFSYTEIIFGDCFAALYIKSFGESESRTGKERSGHEVSE